VTVKYDGPDDVVAQLGDGVFLDVVATARVWPAVAIDEAELRIKELREKKSGAADDDVMIYDIDPAYAAIAAVGADDTRAQLIKALMDLRLGVTRKLIDEKVEQIRLDTRRRQQQAKERAESEGRTRTALDLLDLFYQLVEYYKWRRGVHEGVPWVESLFCINTYRFDIFDTTPYLSYSSATPGCGKTVSAKRHKAICCRPRMFIEPSPATIFRLVDKERPTLILDEMERLDGYADDTKQIMSVLNGGYESGATVPRCEERDGVIEVKDYHIYCPKILLKIGNFKGTLLDRSISFALSKEYGLQQSFSYLVKEKAAPLVSKLEAYAAQKRAALEEIYKQQRDCENWPFLGAREYEIWLPLLLVAKLISGECAGKEGTEFEEKVLAFTKEFTGVKARLSVDDDESAAKIVELLEALSTNLETLVDERESNSQWRERDANRITASALVERVAKKEAWGAHFAKLKSGEKGRPNSVSSFIRSFRPNSPKHDNDGNHYDVFDLSCRLADHIPPATEGEFWDLLKALGREKTHTYSARTPENGSGVSLGEKSADSNGVKSKASGFTREPCEAPRPHSQVPPNDQVNKPSETSRSTGGTTKPEEKRDDGDTSFNVEEF